MIELSAGHGEALMWVLGLDVEFVRADFDLRSGKAVWQGDPDAPIAVHKDVIGPLMKADSDLEIDPCIDLSSIGCVAVRRS